MYTADPVPAPRPSHPVKVVDKSTLVNSYSRFCTDFDHASVNSSRSAMGCTTEGFDALREFDEAPFAVTLGDGRIAMMPAPPAVLPPPFINANLVDDLWITEIPDLPGNRRDAANTGER